jgi:hypothetical protein
MGQIEEPQPLFFGYFPLAQESASLDRPACSKKKCRA